MTSQSWLQLKIFLASSECLFKKFRFLGWIQTPVAVVYTSHSLNMYGSSRSVSKIEVVGSNGNGSASGSPGRSPRLPHSPRLGHRRNSSSSSTGGLTGSGKTLSMENIQSMNAAYATGGPTYFTDTAEDPVGVGSLSSGLNPSLPKSTMTLGRAGFRVPSGVRAAIIGSSPNINSGAVVPTDAIAFGGEMQSQTSQAATVPHSMRQVGKGIFLLL